MEGKSLKRFVRDFKEQLVFNHEEEWFNYLLSPVGKSGQGNKLRTYVKFKRSLDFENYLCFVENMSHRISLTKLRISAHPLRIERGRYERINNRVLPEIDRLCKYCKSGTVEDEYHFVITCSLYDQLRSDLLAKLSLTDLSKNDLFVVLMSSKRKNIAQEFGKYVDNCFKLRLQSVC